MAQRFLPCSRLSLLTSVLASLVGWGSVGCSSSTDSGPGSAEASGSSGSTSGGPAEAGSAASVSFANQVVPVLQASCGIGGIACHGDPSVTSSSPPRPYFDPGAAQPGNAAAAANWNALVSKSSSEAPSLLLVKPGDPANSYLQHKLDNTLSTLAAQCGGGANNGSCGLSMPSGTMLSQDKRDLFRTWIAEGALNN